VIGNPESSIPDWASNLPLAFLLLFGAISILCGLLLFALGWRTLRLRLGQSRWTRVPAEILSVDVEPHTFDESRMFLPKVTYRFSAGGGTVTVSRLRLLEQMYSKERIARRKLEKYQPGTTVMASFPSGQPQEAVLEPGGGLVGGLVLLLGLAMVAAPLFVGHLAGLPVEPVALGIVILFCLCWIGSITASRRERRAKRSGLLPPPGSGTDDDVEKLLAQGEKLLAIRLYRELHHTDLKTAKEAVEKLGGSI